MYCPRINHFVRLNQNGSIGRCGHMNTNIGFESVNELENSDWTKTIKEKLESINLLKVKTLLKELDSVSMRRQNQNILYCNIGIMEELLT